MPQRQTEDSFMTLSAQNGFEQIGEKEILNVLEVRRTGLPNRSQRS
jgi:hypothetical protein